MLDPAKLASRRSGIARVEDHVVVQPQHDRPASAVAGEFDAWRAAGFPVKQGRER
ncbi:MAG TPA: hypothetical protein VGQ46_21425 [Thermoanaerobaculia bacterium]|nr:hypothetical protein [Thermoanaerobaculia bacterium]